MLSISDFAKYLESGLKVQYIPNGKDYELLNIGRYGDIHLETIELGAGMVERKDVKPYLRPISQMAEEITHDGQTFVPIVELAKLAGLSKFAFTGFINGTAWVDLYEEDNKVCFAFLESVFGISQPPRYVVLDDQHKFYKWCYKHHFWLGVQDLFRTGEILELKN